MRKQRYINAVIVKALKNTKVRTIMTQILDRWTVVSSAALVALATVDGDSLSVMARTAALAEVWEGRFSAAFSKDWANTVRAVLDRADAADVLLQFG